jgi:hypothetical protein
VANEFMDISIRRSFSIKTRSFSDLHIPPFFTTLTQSHRHGLSPLQNGQAEFPADAIYSLLHLLQT